MYSHVYIVKVWAVGSSPLLRDSYLDSVGELGATGGRWCSRRSGVGAGSTSEMGFKSWLGDEKW